MGTSSGELLIELDRLRGRELRSQLEVQLRDAICAGRLAAGTALPSTRALAADLGVTRGVVVGAYDQLIAEGYLLSRRGSSTVVNRGDGHSASSPQRRRTATPSVEIDFRPSVPELQTFPRAAWLRATRTAWQRLPDKHLGYTDPRGLGELRVALAEYLGRVRGIIAAPEQVVVCNGFAHGLSLVARQLLELGHEIVAVEDPGHDGPRGELAWLGLGHHPIAVDGGGIVVDDLRRSPARAALVTPAHQFPTGAVLAPGRRRQLVEWANDVDGFVIEDDYDAEFRYDRHPVGAMQGLAPDRIVYSGTVSKSLAPGLRLGWLVLPPPLVRPIAASRQLVDHATSVHVQATFSAFLGSGDLDRHLRRMRRTYRLRRDAITDALARWLPDAVPSGVAAGMHVLVTLPNDVDEVDLTARAADAGVRVYPLGQFRVRRRPGHAPAILLGYGRLEPSVIDEGVRRLADAVEAARR